VLERDWLETEVWVRCDGCNVPKPRSEYRGCMRASRGNVKRLCAKCRGLK